ncbi:MAG: glycosyltransferase [Acidimicrobiales bacterium]
MPDSVTRHVCYVLKRFPRLSETFIVNELLELHRQGERVSVLAISKPVEAAVHGFLEELDIPVTYLPHRPLRQPLRTAAGVAVAFMASPRGWVVAARTCLWPPRMVGLRKLLQASVLRRELRHLGASHVHAHFATAAAGLAELVHRMGGPSYSVTSHAKDIWHEQVEDDDLRAKLGAARFVATVSQANVEHLTRVLGPGTPVHLVPNSVDVRRLGADERRPEPGRVLAVARLVEKKGLEDLVAACALLGERRPVHLVVVGAGPLRDRLAAQGASLAVDLDLLGAQSREVVLDELRRASAFALPCVVAADGDRDGLPTSVLEAMALGTPVVTTAVNGLADAVLDGETGLVVPEHDPPALAEALGRLLDEPALAARLAVAARQRVE